MLELSKKITLDQSIMESKNLCHLFNDEDLKKIGSTVFTGYEQDVNSRSQWLRRNEAGMNFALQVSKDKNWPWPNCSNVIFPLVSIASLQFSSRAYANIISGTDIVKMRVIGEDPSGDLTARAERVGTHMSWQCMEQDIGWEEQHDRLFINQAIVGTSFIKTSYNATLGYQVGELVLARDLVMNYYSKSVDDCPRKTHVFRLFRNDIYERVKRGTFRDVLEEGWYITASAPADTQPHSLQADARVQKDNRQGLHPPQPDEDSPFEFFEQHRLLDLDQDGYYEPYIVTIEAVSQCVVRIVARWDKESQIEKNENGSILRIIPTEYFTKYGFIPSPDGGIYDIGFGVLLGPLNEAVNTSINQLLDAGTMQNSLGGLLGRGAKLRGGEYAMAPWEWKRVDATGDDLRKNVYPWPERQPSAVLFNLLNLLIEYTNRLGSVAEQMVGKTPGQNTPAETSRNALEQGMQVFSTIFKRVWRSMKDEFKKRFVLNSVYLRINFTFGEGDTVRREDYTSAGADLVCPAADPNMASLSQRFFKAQSVRQASRETPGYDLEFVELNFLRALQIESPKKFYPGVKKTGAPQDPKLAIAQLNFKMAQMQLQHEQAQFMLQLMEERKLNTAKILQLTAAAAKDMAEIKGAHAERRLQTLQLAIDALQSHNEMINNRLTALGKLSGEGGTADEQSAGPTDSLGPEESGAPPETDSGAAPTAPSMETGPDDSAIPTDLGNLEEESTGAMG